MIPNILSKSDCLNILERVPTSAIAMIYLDPPWNTGKKILDDSAIEDYDIYFSKVIQQLHRILIKEGSLLFHSSPQYSKNLVNMLDEVFGKENFRNEYILSTRHKNSQIGPLIQHESIFFYSKSNNFTYNEPMRELTKDEIKRLYPYSDKNGHYHLESLLQPNERPKLQFSWDGIYPPEGKSWRYSRAIFEQFEEERKIVLDEDSKKIYLKKYMAEFAKVPLGSIWDDISLRIYSKEKVNYHSQKPLMLLERLIKMTTNTGDIILDPFLGSGTTLIAAEKLGRQWIGCDINNESIDISIDRLQNLNLIPDQYFTYIDETELDKVFPVIHKSYVKLFNKELLTVKKSFIINEPVSFEETRYSEFKEIKGNNPVRSIVDIVDQYAVAFLNCEGGSIYWGIRDSDRLVVGVRLDYSQRDEIRRITDEKLSSIQPSVALSSFKITFHEVFDGNNPVKDLYVLQVDIPQIDSRDLYFTAQNEAYLKTDGGKKKLSGPAIQQEILKRFL